MSQDELFPTRRSLVNRLKDWDDQESWREFFNAYWRLIYSAAIRAGLNEQEAEDVVQETVAAVARKMPDFKYDPAICSFKTWLRVLTQRRIADRFRVRGRQVPTVDLPPGDDTTTAPMDQVADPASLEPDPKWEEDWERNLVRAAMEAVKQQVSARQFQIYDYHVVQGHGVAQTCKALGVSVAQVYLAKHRVGKLVKQAVADLQGRFV